jgi:hypothetical protein
MFEHALSSRVEAKESLSEERCIQLFGSCNLLRKTRAEWDLSPGRLVESNVATGTNLSNFQHWDSTYILRVVYVVTFVYLYMTQIKAEYAALSSTIVSL